MSKRNRLMGWWATMAAAALLCMDLPAGAQEDGQRRGQGRGRFGGGGFQVSNWQLVQADQVQQELKLADDQKQTVEQIAQETGGKMREAREGGQEGGYREISQQADEQVAGVLKQDQAKRLDEIRLQVNGLGAVPRDRELAQKLKVSPEQREEISEVLQKQSEKYREAFAQGEGIRERMEELRKETNEQLLAVLTDEQKQQWKEMTGKPFELDRSQLFRGFGGGRGPGGGRPRGNN